MNIIHFTHGATDPLKGFYTQGAHYVRLAEGHGDTATASRDRLALRI
jgi:hypothetical protein